MFIEGIIVHSIGETAVGVATMSSFMVVAHDFESTTLRMFRNVYHVRVKAGCSPD